MEKAAHLTWQDVSHEAMNHLQIQVKEVSWFSTYHVHHRLAERFREGKVFLLGDAAHIHSPVGGQGMNTGIGDAVNLAWKLAQVLQRKAAERILESFEPERMGFARQLVETTDRGFTLATSPGPIAKEVRLKLIPFLVPIIFNFSFVRRFMFRLVSQIQIHYRTSPLSQGSAGKIHAGDRLPWSGDNFEALKSLRWQVHIYGDAHSELEKLCQEQDLALHIFPWREERTRAGLMENALYVVRPDGYIAFTEATIDIENLHNYLTGIQSV